MRAIDEPTSPPLARFGAIHRAAVRAEWAAARATGLDLRIEDDGEMLLGAAPGATTTMFGGALGFAEHPERIDAASAFFAGHGVVGEIVLDPADVPRGVVPRVTLEAYLGTPGDVRPSSSGVAFRSIGPDEIDAWTEVVVEGYGPDPDMAALWRAMASHWAADPDRIHVAGESDGRLVAASSTYVTGRSAWLSWATVVRSARGRDIQRSMIATRTRIAAERGCDTIAAWALASAHSSANLAGAGLPLIGERVVVSAADLG